MAISSPAGLRVSFTTIPAFLGSDAGTPREYYNLGRVNVGNSFGYLPHVEILCSPQIVLDLPAGLTVVAWDFAPGVVASIQELVESAPVKADPWDRNAVVWTAFGILAATAPQVSTTLWTYTVPAGRWLQVDSLEISAKRDTVATTAGNWSLTVTIGSVTLLQLRSQNNVVGDPLRDQLMAGSLFLSAGTVISATAADSSTAGQVRMQSSAAGLLFDV